MTEVTAASSSSASKNNSFKMGKPSIFSTVIWSDIIICVLLIVVSIFSYPPNFFSGSSLIGNLKVPLSFVWYYGWITALSTGLGALPFIFFKEPSKFWVGVSNAVAGGMCTAASYSLVSEGILFDSAFPPLIELITNINSSASRTIIGFTVGVIFVIVITKVLDKYDSLEVGDISTADYNKMFLIIFVMTLHSLTEGIGIGVSFGGAAGMQFGPFVSLSLALHNVPEGLAVALVLTQRKVNVVRAGLLAVFTSLPQPLFAIPAFLFVERFSFLLPIGLGFAAGAMVYVAIFELLSDSVEDLGLTLTGCVGLASCFLMLSMQHGLKYIL